MKKIILTVVLAVLMLGLVACQNENVIGGTNESTGIFVSTPTESPVTLETPTPKDEETDFDFDVEYKQDSLYAMKYLGFRLDEIAYEVDTISLPGEEYYLIIPRYENMQINIYENIIADTEEFEIIKELRYTSSSAKPIAICGNESDIFPNITVELIYKDESTEFSPYISCENGDVSTTDEKGIIVN